MSLIKTNLLILPENKLAYIFLTSILKKDNNTMKLHKTTRNIPIGLQG